MSDDDRCHQMQWPAPIRPEFLVAGRFRVRWFAELDSTNRYAMDAMRAGADDGLVVVADHQSAGRGRLGRSWDAGDAEALLASIAFRGPIPVAGARHLSAAVGVALAEAVAACTGTRPAHKWPNDLVVGDAKLAGVLAEADAGADGVVGVLVVGAGTNVASVPAEYAASAISCDRLASRPVDREELLVAWLDALAARLADPAGALAEVRAHNATVGRRVRVDLAHRTVDGVAVSLTDEGALVVRDDAGVEHEIAAGDVVHLRPRDRPR